ncbi:hypothetical protein HYALB_00001455 [Hymenoscyphus albidus]|uniref:CAP-Gly domain-containing protein n=1 Tax=Hymenoscyphus albidus TaxID=595503 RepID=A0A9N9LBV5_9HELO|nr:hypothetical protein HYALB_00001455 [Hymenoscyphus albidus]
MPPKYHVGQRVSFSNSPGTIRYIGPVDGAGKENVRLGVEWDNPARGKHDGKFKGKRYFECLSGSPTGGSLMRINVLKDPEQSFVEAVHEKYDPPEEEGTENHVTPNVISGKVVEEVGFDKIKKQQAQLHKLSHVLVDGMRISSAETPHQTIRETCPKIVELDLSRNLFDDFEVVVRICGELDALRSVRLNNNKFPRLKNEKARKELTGVIELEMNEMYMPFHELIKIARLFPSLTTLTACSNAFTSVTCPLEINTLTSLTLEWNRFTNLSQLSKLTSLHSLEILKLKGNRIFEITNNADKDNTADDKPLVFGSKLQYLDLSYNEINTWEFVDDLATTFPGLTALRLSHNPIYASTHESKVATSLEEASLITTARLKSLTKLDFETITPERRNDAEGYYMSLIGKALAAVPEEEEGKVIAKHKRYHELCKIHGPPAYVRRSADTVNPDFLEARLINFEFYLVDGPPFSKQREIPKSYDVYRVKGIVATMFNLKPLKLKLTWETGIWDPVAGYEEDEESSDAEDIEEEKQDIPPKTDDHKKGRWMKREVEIENSTRQIGVCVDGNEAKVRVELLK